MGSPLNEGYFWGVTRIRIVAFWGLYWGPPVVGNYPVSRSKSNISVLGAGELGDSLSRPERGLAFRSSAEGLKGLRVSGLRFRV